MLRSQLKLHLFVFLMRNLIVLVEAGRGRTLQYSVEVAIY